MTTYLGVDPGLSGGLACIAGDAVEAIPMPTVKIGTKTMVDMRAVRDWIINCGIVELVMIEDVNAGAVRLGGPTAAFAFGRGYGRIEGLLDTLDRPYDYVASPTWTKALGITKGAGKAEHIAVAHRLFPTTVFRPTQDGPADALLIAEYGRRLHSGRVAA